MRIRPQAPNNPFHPFTITVVESRLIGDSHETTHAASVAAARGRASCRSSAFASSRSRVSYARGYRRRCTKSRRPCCRRRSAPTRIRDIADKFVAWTRGYREGVALAHGYGHPRLQKSGPSPVPALSSRSSRRSTPPRGRTGGALVGARPRDAPRAARRGAREGGCPCLPPRPTGQHVVADLMAFYFRSSEANDDCYSALINREVCRPIAITTQKAARPLELIRRQAPCPFTKPTSASSAAASRPRCSRRSCPSCGPASASSSSRPADRSSTRRTAGSTGSARSHYGEHPWPRRLHRGSAGQRHHLDDDGRRRPGAALGRRVQPVLGGRPPAEVDVRPGRRLADRVAASSSAITAKRSGG